MGGVLLGLGVGLLERVAAGRLERAVGVADLEPEAVEPDAGAARVSAAVTMALALARSSTVTETVWLTR